MKVQPKRPGSQRRSHDPSQLLRMTDAFEDDVAAGRVIGSTGSSGMRRLGRDAEKALSVDHDALRIRYLRDPGWGRASLAYGPFRPVPGLTLAVDLLQGLPSSQTHNHLPEPRRARAARILRTRRIRRSDIHESLAVGWFEAPVPPRLPAGGPCFVAAANPDDITGELLARGEDRRVRLIHGLQNVPLTLLVVIRHGDAALYASSLPGAFGLPGHPWMRPLGTIPMGPDGEVFAGLHQSVISEVGYELDTRVHRVAVERLPQFADWYSTAHAAHRTAGAGSPWGDQADLGGRWMAHGGSVPGGHGVPFEAGVGPALLDPGQPSGLVQVQVETGPAPSPVSLVWRSDGEKSWQVEVSPSGARLTADGEGGEVAADSRWGLQPNTRHTLNVLDDGVRVGAYLDGRLLFDRWFDGETRAHAAHVGFALGGDDVRLHRFEAHPRRVRIPTELRPRAPWVVVGRDPVVHDPFDGPAGDLQGTATPEGRCWRRAFGKGTIERTGSGDARVRASLERPNPGRTIYILPWEHPSFADLSVTLTPPGTAWGQRHAGRTGLVFWQDEDNYLLVNHWLEDTSKAVSISAFLRVRGQEQMREHDAVWTNVGRRLVRYGEPFRLRIVCDGARFLAFVDGEPVLHRALTDYRADAPRLELRGVGVAANWEWGDDTGTRLEGFVARGPQPSPATSDLPDREIRARLRG